MKEEGTRSGVIGLHPEAERFRQTRIGNHVSAFETMSPVQAREAMRLAREKAAIDPPTVGEVRDELLDNAGAAVRIRLYRPDEGRSAGAIPAIMFLHGGGWVTGDLDSHDYLCRQITNFSGCAVLAVEYRLAPEHPFPAGLSDVEHAFRWLRDNAEAVGVDPERLAMGGDSAGGNLAAVCAIRARDGHLPPVHVQFLLYPPTDLQCCTVSHALELDGLPVTGSAMRWFRDHYIAQADPAAWMVSPLRAEDLYGVAPAFVLTAGFDPVRDEGLSYVQRLRAEGVPVRHEHLPEQIHGFLTLGAAMPSVHEQVKRLGQLFSSALADPAPFAD